MIRRDGYVKVLDFGLAKLTERPALDARSANRFNGQDGSGKRDGNGDLYVAGAGARSTGGRAHRRVEPRRGALRDDQPAAGHSKARPRVM